MKTCMCIISSKFRFPGGTAKPVANMHKGLLVKDLSSYSIQHRCKLLKADLDQTDNTLLSYSIMKRKHRNTGHKYHANPPHVWSACVVPWLQTDPEADMTFKKVNPTCQCEQVSQRTLRGAGFERLCSIHILAVGLERLTSRRMAQWTVMMTKPWTESKTAKRTWRTEMRVNCFTLVDYSYHILTQRLDFFNIAK